MATPAGITSALKKARQELLDVSARNRLINTPRSKTRSTRLELSGEQSDDVFQRLVVAQTAMSFRPIPEKSRTQSAEENDYPLLPALEDDEVDNSSGGAIRHENKLQTTLGAEALQKRLLKLFYDARTFEEEQGVSLLYLAQGFLQWYEDKNSNRERFAPLLLIPVSLERASANSRFTLRFRDDDISTNLSLQARLKDDFGIVLPDVPDAEELVPSQYFGNVAKVCAQQPGWRVLPNDMVLWFFSFSKFLMYRDLQPENWPTDQGLEQHALIQGLLQEGLQGDPPLCGENDSVDRLLPPEKMVHVLDADSSQAVVIEEVARGRSLVIQGPPGTGKSQTIANLIAGAVKAGKSVLFVAEKMAALEVVERRLANLGLRDMCLELHGHKANKRAMLQELDRTLQLGPPTAPQVDQLCTELGTCRERLNRYVELIHTPFAQSGRTPYQVVGALVRLRAAGTRPADFALEKLLDWTHDDLKMRLALLRELVLRVEQIGPPAQHPWRGVELEVVLPTDVDRFVSKLPSIGTHLEQLRILGTQIAKLLAVAVPQTLQDLAQVGRLAQCCKSAPAMDRTAIGHRAWAEQRAEIQQLVESGEGLTKAIDQLHNLVKDQGWSIDAQAVRDQLAAHGRSWLRFFRSDYRAAVRAFKGMLTGDLPKAHADRLSILDMLLAGQQARKALQAEAADALGQQAFGARWCGEQSDWKLLAAICDWEINCRQSTPDAPFREALAQLDSLDALLETLKQLGAVFKPTVTAVREVFDFLRLDPQVAFGCRELTGISTAELVARIRVWMEQSAALSRWVQYRICDRKVAADGMAELAAQIFDGRTLASEAVSRCELAYYETLMREICRQHTELASFDRVSHERLLEQFRKLDRQRIEASRHEVALAHHTGLPSGASRLGEMGTIRHEIQKKRRHLPIRQLLGRAGRAVQAIKPVFMMSPISVAQYLQPGSLDFDLLLIDEASQVQPVDALGAVARTKQLVVVGDSRQLPPTSFFSRLLGEDGDEEEDLDQLAAADVESILGLCCAQGVPERMLRWHYRSRHHSLIAVSNREFYDNQLYVVPSPSKPVAGHGLVFEYVAEGVFDRGGTATNRVEAQSVAAAVMHHARQDPQRTLGVGTFSVAQRDAILDELEQLRRADPSAESFFTTNAAEPFFVKNLENIQGDERDVILISVGYAKDPSGFFSMNFGPLSNEGGERRLNVLITRARDCCRVFSGLRADDIDLNRARARGAAALKSFLKYAETGLLDTGTPTGRDCDSDFERQVGSALAAAGFQTEPQVGVAGFFIDLAVIDPECPGRYLLGVECDGANYHRSRSARDRDRLRQSVLEDRDWIIHRIWSTDWFHRPEEELRRLLAAIEDARLEQLKKKRTGVSRPPTTEAPAVISPMQRQPMPVAQIEQRITSEPYVVASFRISSSWELQEVPPNELARVILKVVTVEGPIHADEIARRVTQLFGFQRTGNRISQAVSRALNFAAKQAQVVCDNRFYALAGETRARIRDRGEVPSPTLRKPEMLPPAEIRLAIEAITDVHFGIQRTEVVTEAARLFGFKSTSANLREVIDAEIERLLASGRLVEQNNKLYPRGQGDQHREFVRTAS